MAFPCNCISRIHAFTSASDSVRENITKAKKLKSLGFNVPSACIPVPVKRLLSPSFLPSFLVFVG